MGTKLPPKELELYNYIDEILFFKWDPIGVSDDPDARTEYRMYLPQVYRLVKEGKTAKEIAFYLSDIQLDRMGLPSNEEHALECAQMILSFAANLD